MSDFSNSLHTVHYIRIRRHDVYEFVLFSRSILYALVLQLIDGLRIFFSLFLDFDELKAKANATLIELLTMMKEMNEEKNEVGMIMMIGSSELII